MRVAGFVVLWIVECAVNGGQLLLFLLTRHRVKKRMSALIGDNVGGERGGGVVKEPT